MALQDRIRIQKQSQGLTTAPKTISGTTGPPTISGPPARRSPGAGRGAAGRTTGAKVAPIIVAAGIGAAGSFLGGIFGGRKKGPTVDPEEFKRLGTPGLQSDPNQQFFNRMLGGRLRAIESLAGSQRQASSELFASRNIRGTPGIQAFGQIGAQAQAAGQEAVTGIQALQFDEFQQARQFERAAFLERLRGDVAQDRTPWYASFFASIGQSGGTAAGFLLRKQTTQSGTGTLFEQQPERV